MRRRHPPRGMIATDRRTPNAPDLAPDRNGVGRAPELHRRECSVEPRRKAPMGIAPKVARDFADGVRARGRAYFSKGRVLVRVDGPGEIAAKVRGTTSYRVRLWAPRRTPAGLLHLPVLRARGGRRAVQAHLGHRAGDRRPRPAGARRRPSAPPPGRRRPAPGGPLDRTPARPEQRPRPPTSPGLRPSRRPFPASRPRPTPRHEGPGALARQEGQERGRPRLWTRTGARRPRSPASLGRSLRSGRQAVDQGVPGVLRGLGQGGPAGQEGQASALLHRRRAGDAGPKGDW